MIFFIAVSLLAADFFIALIIKNLLNGLPWNNFPLWYAGTLIGIFINGLIILLLVILNFRTSSKEITQYRRIPLLTFTGILILLAGYALMVYGIFDLREVVYWDYQLSYILPGILFTLRYLILLGILSFLWLKVFRTEAMFPLRLIVNILYGALLLTGFALFYSFTANPPLYDKGNVYKTGVVLGAAVKKDNTPGSAHLRRLDAARQLLQEGVISDIFLTGSNTPGKISEAEAGQSYLIKKGISKEVIRFEKETTSTVEQIRYIDQVMPDQTPDNQIIIISDGFHLPRIHQIASFYNLRVNLQETEENLSITQKLYLSSREAVALLIFWLYGI
ncbi:MAG: YdcF family protein [Ignavibacteriales bacterium]|nr:MAG: YdcF family protein [Ignavibacteriales bacterium]